MQDRPGFAPSHRACTATRPQAWNTWTRLAGQAPATTEGQRFEHFYLSLQAAGAGLGVAIGPWQLVRDDLSAGLLAAPLGFLADGSSYHLLTRDRCRPESLPPCCWNGCAAARRPDAARSGPGAQRPFDHRQQALARHPVLACTLRPNSTVA